MGLFGRKKKQEEMEQAFSAKVVEAAKAEYARTRAENNPSPRPQRPMHTLPNAPKETAEYLEQRQAALNALERQEPLELNDASEQLLYELCAAKENDAGQETISVRLASDEVPFLREVQAEFSISALQKYVYFIQYLLGQMPGVLGNYKFCSLKEANGLNPAYPKLVLLGQAAGLVSPFAPKYKLGAPCISLSAYCAEGFEATYAPGDPRFQEYKKHKPKEIRQLKRMAESLPEAIPAPSYDNYPICKEIQETLEKWHTLDNYHIGMVKVLGPFFSDEEWEALDRLKGTETEAAWLTERGIEAFENKQYKEALALLQEAARYGDPDALCQLGDCYYNGCGVRTNLGTAMELYKKAGMRGSLKAIFQVGCMYYHGYSVPRDRETACHWLEDAALAGYADAQVYLAKGCFSGEIGYAIPLKKRAEEYLQMAADQGHAEAKLLLAKQRQK